MTIEWRTERWPVNKLKDFPKNPRVFTDKGMADLKRSLQSLGYIDPIAINQDGTIIGGHARRRTLIEMGLREVDVRVPDVLLTQKQVEEAIIRLNRNTAGQWDFKTLEDSFDHAELLEWGFEKSEFNAFGLKDGKTDPDELPAVPVEPVTRGGDIWLMGAHRLSCGDSTNITDIASLMGDTPGAALVFTDPPYNVDYEGCGGNNLGKIKNDSMSDKDFDVFLDNAFKAVQQAMAPLACIYVCHPDSASAPKMAFEKAFSAYFKKSSTIIWCKQSAGVGWQDYRCQHEPILYGWKESKGKHYFCGSRAKTTVWDIGRDPQASYLHPTQKPVALPIEAINNSSKEGQIVFDPFGGAGSTLIACEMTSRTGYIMEIDPKYCDVIIQRWQNFTGKKAINSVSGNAFGESIVTANKPKRKAGVT